MNTLSSFFLLTNLVDVIIDETLIERDVKYVTG